VPTNGVTIHDCPEHEAKFAEQHLAKNPDGPFSAFLPLLIANRWLCAAEGYGSRRQSPPRGRRPVRWSHPPGRRPHLIRERGGGRLTAACGRVSVRSC
jgi:hypothetical protein